MIRAAFAAVLVVSSVVAVAQQAKPVAIVAAVSGTASASGRNLALFDWVPAGTSIEVAPKSRVVLAFADGRRWEVSEKAKITVTERGVTAQPAGASRQLSSVSPLPAISAIPVAANQRAAAIRVRGVKLTGLYPDNVSLADATVLRFDADPAASRYHVEVEDESGNTVFQAETASPSVAISPGILKPDAHYYWYVRTVDRNGPAARGEADFTTLGAEQVRARNAFAESLQPNDVSALALLAEVDRSLGLLWDARQSLEAALAHAPGDPALQAALARIDSQLRSHQ